MRLLLVAFFVLLPMTSKADPTDVSKPTSKTIVRGDVLLVEGEYYVVKEISGREVRVHVNAETKMEGVAGKVTPEGHAATIALQIPGIGTTPIPSPKVDSPSISP